MGRPLKPCACGCGELTTRTYRLKHRPIKRYPTRAHGEGTQRVHILRAEKALGKPLPPGAEVHHADGSKDADAPLVICPNRAYHGLLHVRLRVLQAGGDPDAQRICSACKALRLIGDMVFNKGEPSNCCKACLRRIARERYASLATATS